MPAQTHEERAIRRVPSAGRVRRGLRRQANWLQLLRFLLVGVSGYVVNVAVFALSVHVAGLDYRLAACVSFIVAVTNNFIWHRRWTFDVRHGSVGYQGSRFLSVSLVSFATSLAILEVLVSIIGLDKVLAQAVALAAVAPLSFVVNKFWSFRR